MSKITNCILNKDSSCVPIWFMRQAGRYLPEFREIRKQNPNFINLCLNSDLSTEITLQPLARFNLDAAIIFSDILIVPYGLGQEVKFEKNKGPLLSKFSIDKFLNTTEKDFINKLNPVYEAIKKTREKLSKEKSLISFVGSPWTLIVYMLGLKAGKNILNLEIIKNKKNEIKIILEKIDMFLKIHIDEQIKAGADIIQIFDSWAGMLPLEKLNNLCFEPNLKLVDFCKKNKIPVICFPRGIKENYKEFSNIVNPDCLNIDYDINPEWALKNLNGTCIQGGMNPKVLLMDEKKIFLEAEKYLKMFKNYPYIFNLGHGLLPETKPENVDKLINFVKEYKQK